MTHPTLNPVVQAVMKILLENGPGAAEDYLNSHLLPELERAREQVVRLEHNFNAARNVIMLASSPAEQQQKPRGVLSSHSFEPEAPTIKKAVTILTDENSRRSVVVATAEEVAARNGGVVTTSQVIEALAEKSMELPGGRPGTSIGNILHKDPSWKRVGEGVFSKEQNAEAAGLL